MSLCPGCGEPVGKHQAECHGCNADLTLARRRAAKPHRVTIRQRMQPEALLLARQEAARLHLPKGGDGESPEEFIQRVNDAVTKDLEDRARGAA